jgi:hypothetical protein
LLKSLTQNIEIDNIHVMREGARIPTREPSGMISRCELEEKWNGRLPLQRRSEQESL